MAILRAQSFIVFKPLSYSSRNGIRDDSVRATCVDPDSITLASNLPTKPCQPMETDLLLVQLDTGENLQGLAPENPAQRLPSAYDTIRPHNANDISADKVDLLSNLEVLDASYA
ncbi:hypothetical protein CcaCcLH18_11508 [Colletotrichum camelliae]|nr:hypothetical protein CcaCcLH18_11508 [Colletotrichum camelliae]